MRADLPQLAERRDQLTRRFFAKMTNTDNCLTYLLPIKRDSQITGSLRAAKAYPRLRANTCRFQKSFLPFALANYQ